LQNLKYALRNYQPCLKKGKRIKDQIKSAKKITEFEKKPNPKPVIPKTKQ
jgi:hypothetical protein